MDEGESSFLALLYWFYTLWSWMISLIMNGILASLLEVP